MAWTAPKTWSVGEIVTAANMNLHLRDNLNYLGTKESIWVPVGARWDGTNFVAIQASDRYAGAALVSATDFAVMGAILIPSDFGALVSAVIVVRPNATQAAANWDTYSNYAAVGQSTTTHTGSNTVSTYNVTDGILFAVDVAGILANLAANDILGLQLSQATAAHNVTVLGARLKYTIA